MTKNPLLCLTSYDSMYLLHKLNSETYAISVLFALAKMHALFGILVVCFGGLCSSNRSYAFFVRGYGRALLMLEEKP